MTHGCKGYFFLCNCDCWLRRGKFYVIFYDFGKKSQFHLLFFIVDSQNPKFSLEYLENKTRYIQTWQKLFFCELWNFGKAHFAEKKRVNYDKFEIVTNCLNQIFNLKALCFFLLTCSSWYYHTIYLVTIYFELCIDYENDIFEVISNLHILWSKFGGKINKFGGKP